MDGICQMNGYIKISKSTADSLGSSKNIGINPGIAFGFASPLKRFVAIERILDDYSFVEHSNITSVFSFTLSYPLLKKIGRIDYYQKADKSGKPIGNSIKVRRGLSIIANVNVYSYNHFLAQKNLTFGLSKNTFLGESGILKKRLDGGMGLAYSFDNNLQLALSYNLVSFYQPRSDFEVTDSYIVNLESKSHTVIPLTKDAYEQKYLACLLLQLVYCLKH